MTGDDNEYVESFSRRRVVGGTFGLGALLWGGYALGPQSSDGSSSISTASQDEDNTGTDAEEDEAVAEAEEESADEAAKDAVLRAQLADVDMSLSYDVNLRLQGDPAGADRTGVVHVTTHGEVVEDYATSVVNLRNQGVTIDAEQLEYDYYKAANETHVAPDGVWLTVEVDSGENPRGFLFFKSLDDGLPAGEWRTRDVAAEIRGESGVEGANGSTSGWRVIEIEPQDVATGGEVIQTGRRLRDQTSFDSIIDWLTERGCDPAESKLAAAGFGRGNVSEAICIDTYYDDLTADGVTYNFPATVPMDLELQTEGDGDSPESVIGTLQFVSPEEGLELEDVDPDTVRLAAFDRVAPLIDPPAVTAAAVNVHDDHLDVEFDGEEVAALHNSDDETTVNVLGDFEGDERASPQAEGNIDTDYRTPYSFVGTGSL